MVLRVTTVRWLCGVEGHYGEVLKGRLCGVEGHYGEVLKGQLCGVEGHYGEVVVWC